MKRLLMWLLRRFKKEDFEPEVYVDDRGRWVKEMFIGSKHLKFRFVCLNKWKSWQDL